MKQLPIRHVLYTHYGAYEESDFKAFTNGTVACNLHGVKHLINHFRGLKELLMTPGHEGLLVMFYAPGFAEFLTGIARGKDEQQLIAENPNLRFAKEVACCVHEHLRAANLEDRVRFITSLDLRVILGQAHTILAEKFHRYFVGPAKGIRYDTPKIVESVLRLRLLGNGVPVLRLDHDVIFRFAEGVKVIGDLGLFKAVACASRAYHLRLSDPTVSTFIFSASYNARELKEPTVENKDSFKAWSEAFATRVYPAIVADLDDIRKIMVLPEEQQYTAWDKYVREHIDESLARLFFGLKSNKDILDCDRIQGLTSIGAHPFYAVISGALLCLSEGAILDLPPFSNFKNNVTWIDDHLKYSLHRALHHFTSGETLNLEPGLSDARLDDVLVTKARPFIPKLPSYVLGTYLPTLLWGTIMDAWITVDPILKCRFSSFLDESDREHWRNAKAIEQDAPLPRAMLRVLRIGHFELDAQDELRNALRSSAISRIEMVRQMWAKLKQDNKKTFACYWAEGSVREHFPVKCFAECKDRLWEGIAAAGMPLTDRINSLEDLNNAIAGKVTELCEDAVTYVQWTLDWPQFVQIVRSVPQGTFMGDMTWQQPKC